nr:MAG TPA: hypothetical protein [Caudoviricetes sp.]
MNENHTQIASPISVFKTVPLMIYRVGIQNRL